MFFLCHLLLILFLLFSSMHGGKAMGSYEMMIEG